MDLVWLLMSNSELLRIKNKQKTTYKNQKAASSYKIIHKRPNDRFGFNKLLFQSNCLYKESLALKAALLFYIQHQSLKIFSLRVVDIYRMVCRLMQLMQDAHLAVSLYGSSKHGIAEVVF